MKTPRANRRKRKPRVSRRTRLLWSLISFGVAQLLASLILLVWTFWVLVLDNTIYIAYVTLFCVFYHVIMSLLAVFVGLDFRRHRILTAGCLGMAIIGIVFAINLLIGVGVLWSRYDDFCQNCRGKDANSDTCLSYNCAYLIPVHVPVIALALVMTLIDSTMTYILSVNFCWCCRKLKSVSALPLHSPRETSAGDHHPSTIRVLKSEKH